MWLSFSLKGFGLDASITGIEGEVVRCWLSLGERGIWFRRFDVICACWLDPGSAVDAAVLVWGCVCGFGPGTVLSKDRFSDIQRLLEKLRAL